MICRCTMDQHERGPCPTPLIGNHRPVCGCNRFHTQIPPCLTACCNERGRCFLARLTRQLVLLRGVYVNLGSETSTDRSIFLFCLCHDRRLCCIAKSAAAARVETPSLL